VHSQFDSFEMLSAVLVASCSFQALAGAAGTEKYEWAGIFPTPENYYMWTAQKVKGKYADPTMKLAVLPVTESTESQLDKIKSEGTHAMEKTCTNVAAGSTIVPKKDVCFTLQFDNDMWQSLFKVDAQNAQHLAFFAQHFPTEFEATAHYLKDDHGDDIEPKAELPHKEEATTKAATTHDDDKPWGAAIGASVLVNLVTLIGVIFLVPAFRKLAVDYANELNSIIGGFAGGALLSCAFFLLLFEATHLVATGWSEEVDVLWRWGTMILAGYLLPGLVDNATSLLVGSRTQDSSAAAEGADGDAQKVAADTGSGVTRARLIAGVLIGDFFHNLCDGIFMGAAFKGCGSSFGWGVALGTILHELPQEISDYVILTGPGVGFSPIIALVTNFASGLSVILGAVCILASDIDDSTTGLLLAFGGGVYLQIAATECMPRAFSDKISAKIRIAATGAFIIGAILIGLVLLDHEHCVPSTTSADGTVKPAGGHH